MFAPNREFATGICPQHTKKDVYPLRFPSIFQSPLNHLSSINPSYYYYYTNTSLRPISAVLYIQQRPIRTDQFDLRLISQTDHYALTSLSSLSPLSVLLLPILLPCLLLNVDTPLLGRLSAHHSMRIILVIIVIIREREVMW